MTNNLYIEPKSAPFQARMVRPLDRDEAALVAVRLLDQADITLAKVTPAAKGCHAHRQLLTFVGSDKAVKMLENSEKLRSELRRRTALLNVAIKRYEEAEDVLTFNPVIKSEEEDKTHRPNAKDHKSTGTINNGVNEKGESVVKGSEGVTFAKSFMVQGKANQTIRDEVLDSRGVVQTKPKKSGKSGN